MRLRKIKQFVQPVPVIEGAGVKLIRTIGSYSLDHLDPFLLLDHFSSDNPEDYLAGFPMHPHRGIETVTYMLAGQISHKDSLGNAGTITAGDVQWMTSGGGIMHEEMPAPVDGKMMGFQLWVNLPAKLKMSAPRYQEIVSQDIPEVDLENGIKIRVIAGKTGGAEGPVTEIAVDPLCFDVTIPPDTEFRQNLKAGQTAFAYIFEGYCRFGDAKTDSPNLVVFNDGDYVEARTGERTARLLLVAGKPWHEPIARYGPFVMNTQAEIRQALLDLQNGNFVEQP